MSDNKMKTKLKGKAAKLTPLRAAFALKYVELGNATEAYIQAGFSAANRQVASAEAHKLLRISIVSKEIARIAKAAEDKTVDDTAAIVSLWQRAARVDMREISSLHREACRHCHGVEHAYQWRIAAEFETATLEWAKLPEKIQSITTQPSDEGGYGFSVKLIPHPDCPMCDGFGIERVIFHDTRSYSQAAAIAFDGVAVTANGMKINTLDRLAATEKLARHLGMFKGQAEQQQVDGLTRLIHQIQQRGSKAPVDGIGNAPQETVQK